jgi:hypothetical protein
MLVFLSSRYTDKLFMICAYDAEQKLLLLVFAVVVGDDSVDNLDLLMRWLRTEVVDLEKITVISYQHLDIRVTLRGQILDDKN